MIGERAEEKETSKKVMGRLEQQELERKVFLEFVRRSGLEIDEKTIESREPPEPDIRCCTIDGDYIAFELKQVCDEDIAEWTGYLKKKLNNNENIEEDDTSRRFDDFATSSNKFCEWLKRKFENKNYKTGHPIELLLYTDGHMGLTDDCLFEDIRIESEVLTPIFRTVWFMGDGICKCVIENGQLLDSGKKYYVSFGQEGKPKTCIRKMFGSRKDAIQFGEKFVKANPGKFLPEDGEVVFSWHIAD